MTSQTLTIDGVKFRETATDSLRNKDAASFIDLHFPYLLRNENIKMVGITCVFSPHKITLEESWAMINTYISMTFATLSGFNDISFALCALEIHGASNKKTKKENLDYVKDEEQTDVTMIGYPHLHLLIGVNNYNGVFKDPNVYAQPLSKFFPDICVGAKKSSGRKVDYDNPVNLLKYVIKNAKHAEVVRKTKSLPINFYPIKNNAKIIDFFQDLKTKTVPMNILPPCSAISLPSEGKEELVLPKPSNPLISIKRGPDTPLTIAINRATYYMEQNCLAICNGNIYNKNPKSKMTWEFYMSIDQCVGIFLSHENSEIIQNKGKIVDLMKTEGQRLFPKIKLDYKWVEFADCFLFIGLGLVYKDQNEYPCFSYFPTITYEQIKSNDTNLVPTRWLEILSNSKLDMDKKFLSKLYSLLLPRVHKDTVLYILGPPDSGKTTAIDTVVRLIPDDQRTTLANGGKDFILSTTVGKLILIADEGAGIESMSVSQLLKLLESDSDIAINRKHKDTIVVRTNINIVIASNDDIFTLSNLTDSKVNPIERRIIRYNFTALPNPSPGIKSKVVTEKPNVLLYLARNYFGELEFYNHICETKTQLDEWKKDNYELYRNIADELDLTIK